MTAPVQRSNLRQWPDRNRKRQPPMHSVEEIARYLGISLHELSGALVAHDAPQPVKRIMGASDRMSGRRTLYVLKDVVIWYRKRHPAIAQSNRA